MKSNSWLAAVLATLSLASQGAALAAGTLVTAPLPSYTFSMEGLALTGNAAVTLPNIVVTFGNNLTYQDDIILTLPGVTSVAAVPGPALVTCSPATSAIGYVTQVSGGWNFRVTSVSGVNLGDSCTFSGLQVTALSLSNAAGIISYQAYRYLTGQLVDSARNPVGNNPPAISVKSQFAVMPVTRLNGVVDVYADRLVFAVAESVVPGSGAAAPRRADTLNFDVTRDANGTVYVGPTVSAFRTLVTIFGDWSWVDGADAGDACEPAEFAGNVQGLNAFYTFGAGSNCRQLDLVSLAPSGTTAATGYLYVPGTVPLRPTAWAGRVQWDYYLNSNSNVTSSSVVAWDPGVWSINGAQVFIQYMPYGTDVSHIIYAANTSVRAADATAVVYHEGNAYPCSLGAAAAWTVTDLSGPVNTCVANAGITTGKVAILLTLTAPDKDIEVYSAYNVGGSDRGVVVNTSNGRTFWYGTGFPFVPPAP